MELEGLKDIFARSGSQMKMAPDEAARALGVDSRIPGNLRFNAWAAARSADAFPGDSGDFERVYGITQSEAAKLLRLIYGG